MKYIIVTESSSWKLQSAVNERIADGYQPIGGVSLAVDQGRYEYAQAMVKP